MGTFSKNLKEEKTEKEKEKEKDRV